MKSFGDQLEFVGNNFDGNQEYLNFSLKKAAQKFAKSKMATVMTGGANKLASKEGRSDIGKSKLATVMTGGANKVVFKKAVTDQKKIDADKAAAAKALADLKAEQDAIALKAYLAERKALADVKRAKMANDIRVQTDANLKLAEAKKNALLEKEKSNALSNTTSTELYESAMQDKANEEAGIPPMDEATYGKVNTVGILARMIMFK